ncbi:MAG TPA: Rid family hydrolase [Acidobacteriaceae bacterium]|jgi:2-iminobutanoate/2-iminopropanoate deaminase|nr:Rid family hydrolase [Acidobacteriaceae bacterium]
MTTKVCVDVPGMPAIGPYSHAVRAGGLLFVSGQPGLDTTTGQASPDTEQQMRQAFRNLDTVLRAGGSSLDLVVNTTAIVPDLAHFPLVNQLFAEFFPTAPPARMTINAPLPKGLQFSIGCVAALPDA